MTRKRYFDFNALVNQKFIKILDANHTEKYWRNKRFSNKILKISSIKFLKKKLSTKIDFDTASIPAKRNLYSKLIQNLYAKLIKNETHWFSVKSNSNKKGFPRNPLIRSIEWKISFWIENIQESYEKLTYFQIIFNRETFALSHIYIWKFY